MKHPLSDWVKPSFVISDTRIATVGIQGLVFSHYLSQHWSSSTLYKAGLQNNSIHLVSLSHWFCGQIGY